MQTSSVLLVVSALCGVAGSPESLGVQKGGSFTNEYRRLGVHRNMLGDAVRMNAYRDAITNRTEDLKSASVMDLGTGTGILAHFMLAAGAELVYAVESSAVAHAAELLLEAQGHGSRAKVIHAALEDVQLPRPVDMLVSEPIGTLLVHERMLETYLEARDRFLKPGGFMLPCGATIFAAPFENAKLRYDHLAAERWWQQEDFYGVDLRVLAGEAYRELLSHVVLGEVDEATLLSPEPVRHPIDFRAAPKESVRSFEVPLDFIVSRAANVHGLAFWFDVEFPGKDPGGVGYLSTGPGSPTTHWWQVQAFFEEPLAVTAGQRLVGRVRFDAKSHMTHNVSFTLAASSADGSDAVGNGSHGAVELDLQSFVGTLDEQQHSTAGAASVQGWTPYWSPEYERYYYAKDDAPEQTSWEPWLAEDTVEERSEAIGTHDTREL